MLQLNGVTRRFGSTIAIDNLNIEIPQGQMVAVIGRSGAGKSTLLRMINRLIEPDQGAIRSGQIDVRALRGNDLQRWRARCSMIFQQFNLTGRLDVLTNVLIGRVAETGTFATLFKNFSASDRMRAAEALDRLGLLPQALQRAETLSGGQQQRVAIARVLVQRPDIILADEPIASLDPGNAQVVMDSLRQINREDRTTVICNLHTLDVARKYCDRIVGMSRGRVVFDGSPLYLDEARLSEIYQDDGPGLGDAVAPVRGVRPREAEVGERAALNAA
ncbi:MAG: phnC [Hyphomicrobiales bacterium]|nr:phnC [Hyphomicrobiales bacterium]